MFIPECQFVETAEDGEGFVATTKAKFLYSKEGKL